jgi:hypothetical protein
MTADDWVKIISALASGVVLILGAIATLWVKVHGYRSEVNGRMDQLLELTRSSAVAQGRLAQSIEHGLTPK